MSAARPLRPGRLLLFALVDAETSEILRFYIATLVPPGEVSELA
jgi:hypothetical protein